MHNIARECLCKRLACVAWPCGDRFHPGTWI